MSDHIHIVKSGETLSSIARQYDVSVDEILSLNPEITNRHSIKIGQNIKIPTTHIFINMIFDSSIKKLKVITHKNRSQKTIRYEARSGLPKGSSSIPRLNKKHKLSLKMDVDYTSSKYDDVAWAGPIPGSSRDSFWGPTVYFLKLTEDMTYQKKGGGWGVGGWILKESFWNKFGGRDGFFFTSRWWESRYRWMHWRHSRRRYAFHQAAA